MTGIDSNEHTSLLMHSPDSWGRIPNSLFSPQFMNGPQQARAFVSGKSFKV